MSTRTDRVMAKFTRHTTEFVPFANLGINGVAPNAAAVTYDVVGEHDQPATWTAATTLEGQIGFMLDGPSLGRGVFQVFVRIAASPETPVIHTGYFRLT